MLCPTKGGVCFAQLGLYGLEESDPGGLYPRKTLSSLRDCLCTKRGQLQPAFGGTSQSLFLPDILPSKIAYEEPAGGQCQEAGDKGARGDFFLEDEVAGEHDDGQVEHDDGFDMDDAAGDGHGELHGILLGVEGGQHGSRIEKDGAKIAPETAGGAEEPCVETLDGHEGSAGQVPAGRVGQGAEGDAGDGDAVKDGGDAEEDGGDEGIDDKPAAVGVLAGARGLGREGVGQADHADSHQDGGAR